MPQKKTTTHISDAAIKALVAQSVADALAEHEANRSKNGDDNHDSGSGGKRQDLWQAVVLFGMALMEHLHLLKKKHLVIGEGGQGCHNLTPSVVGERGLKCY
nr:hypothetical protein [Tanacetum cinerariifolium]